MLWIICFVASNEYHSKAIYEEMICTKGPIIIITIITNIIVTIYLVLRKPDRLPLQLKSLPVQLTNHLMRSFSELNEN